MDRIIPQIEHVVVLMLENRSLDNLLGWLYADQENRPVHNVPMPPKDGKAYYDGLVEGKFSNPDQHGVEHLVVQGTRSCNVPKTDPFEKFVYVNEQLFWPDIACGEKPGSAENPKPGQRPTMKGFLVNYSRHPHVHPSHQLDILETYARDQLSVLNSLARGYAVSDRWFCSVPSQTYCNRGFMGAGTSCGQTDNSLLDPFDAPTIWNVLSANDVSWKIYWQDALLGRFFFTRHLFTQIRHGFEDHFGSFETFCDEARAGQLPAYTFLEPSWNFTELDIDFINGNSYHPPAHLVTGEEFVARVFDVLTCNPEAWSKTLLIVTFDEHGGTYDHVRPPWGATPPWANPKASKKPAVLEHDFPFDRFGVRVPTLLVSPWVEKETVFRSATDVPYDHTSILATVLRWQGIPQVDGTWGLGSRTDCAPTFEAALNATEPRTDLPSLGGGSCSGNAAAKATSAITAEVAGAEPLTDFQQSLFGLVVQNATEGRLAPENRENQKIVQEMLELRTQRHLVKFHRRTRWASYG